MSFDLKAVVQERLEALGMGPVEAANKAGLKHTFISDILKGKKRSIRGDNVVKLARALSVDPARLTGADSSGPGAGAPTDTASSAPRYSGIAVRVTGEVAAGVWREHDAEISHMSEFGEFVPGDRSYPVDQQFALVVRGSSVNRVAKEGEILLCLNVQESGLEPRPQDLVIVERRRDQGALVEVTAKRLRVVNGVRELWPDSDDPRFQNPVEIGVHNGEEVVITGKVLWVIARP